MFTSSRGAAMLVFLVGGTVSALRVFPPFPGGYLQAAAFFASLAVVAAVGLAIRSGRRQALVAAMVWVTGMTIVLAVRGNGVLFNDIGWWVFYMVVLGWALQVEQARRRQGVR